MVLVSANAMPVAEQLLDRSLVAVYGSPLLRSRETAEIIAAPRARSCRIDPRLVEIDFGAWEGLTREEIERSDPTGWAAWLREPATTRAGGSGETGQEAWRRVDSFLRDMSAAFPTEQVAIVGHNTVNRLYIAASLGAPLASYRQIVQDNAGISILDLRGNEARWLRINAAADGERHDGSS